MALFYECMLQCARKVLDAADIVRDGDLSTVKKDFLWALARGFKLYIEGGSCS